MRGEKLRCAIIQTIDCQDEIEAVRKSTHRTVDYSLFSKDSIFAYSMMPTSNLFDCLMPYLNLFDVALLPISKENLSYIRTQLYYREASLVLPVVAWGIDLQAVALMDLVKMGLSDFICGPAEFGELVVRLSLMATLGKQPEPPLTYPAQQTAPLNMLADSVGELAYVGQPTYSVKLSFQEAKQHVLAEFERDYVATSLRYHKGNITKAAQQSGKNRRAFWELMRKHHIDAESYRV